MDNRPKVLLAVLIAFFAFMLSVRGLAAQQDYGIFNNLPFEDEVKPKPIELTIEYCERKVRSLNNMSETMDRMGDKTSNEIQRGFINWLALAQECADDLSEKTGKKYIVKKDWFGSGYSLEVN